MESLKLRGMTLGSWSVLGAVVAIAAACGSSDQNVAVRASDAQAGSGGDGGDSGDTPSSSGGSSSDAGGVAASGGAVEAGSGGVANQGGVPSDGGVLNGGTPNAGGDSGAAGAAGSGAFVPEPVTVDTYGCFFHSGDGGDVLASGEPATIVTASPHSGPCDLSWVSDNANAYSPELPPTTIRFVRAFTLDPSIADGTVRISFKADDAVDFVLNGASIAQCTPSAGNAGECQQSCKELIIDSQLLLGAGQTNTLEIQLINLQSASAGNGNFGWTAVSYSVCVTPPS